MTRGFRAVLRPLVARGPALAALALLSCAGGTPPATAPSEYVWRLPPGFPEPPVPSDNPMSAAKVALGRALFFDPRLSGNGTLACAGCHRPELAFTDGRRRALGSTGREHPRSAMSLANVAYAERLDWARPEPRSLEDQMDGPMFNRHPVELGVAGRELEVLQRLAADGEMRGSFRRAFPGAEPSLTIANVQRAIAAFERTLLSGSSPYDRYLFFDRTDEMGAAAVRGMKLFFSERLSCGECHGGLDLARPAGFHNTGLYNLDGRGAYPEGGRGLFEVTGRPEDMGRFRTPTLRNVAVTAPYMHDGSVSSLDAVIDHYAAGGRSVPANPLRSPLLRGFEITAAERADLESFLEALTDRAFLDDPELRAPGDQKLNEAPIE